MIGLAHSPSVLTEHISSNWRASEASETLSGVYKFELGRYILASEQSERDTLRGNAIEISLYLFIN